MEIYISMQTVWSIIGALSCLVSETVGIGLIYALYRYRQRQAMYKVAKEVAEELKQAKTDAVDRNLRSQNRLN